MPSQSPLERAGAELNSNIDTDMKAEGISHLTDKSHGLAEVQVRQAAKPMTRYKIVFCLILCLTFITAARKPAAFAQKAQSKADLTPTFWQRDPDADFEDEGRMHCAPTAVSDGLIYLARAFSMPDLVPGTRLKKDQIKLIEELAEYFHTDPSIGGTNPDRILTGLQNYVKDKGYELSRLEVKTWRPVGKANKEFKIGTKPDMAWMRNAARSKDSVMIMNFGWYYETEDGYNRKGGHWVAVVGAAPDSNEFYIHNPILRAEEQSKKQSLVLNRLDDDFMVVESGGKEIDETNMKGYYAGEGSGLPHGNKVEAILDAVIVFSLKK
jgi:hypothetical protein